MATNHSSIFATYLAVWNTVTVRVSHIRIHDVRNSIVIIIAVKIVRNPVSILVLKMIRDTITIVIIIYRRNNRELLIS